MSEVKIKRLAADSEAEFFQIHSDANQQGWCRCVAWWVPQWDGWSDRSAQANEALRSNLFGQGIHDGYLVYVQGELAGWVQAYRRSAFPKIAVQFGASDNDDAWMIGCVLILPRFRRQGAATSALFLVVEDLRLRGARSIDVFPKRQAADEQELWNGAESTYARLGFVIVKDDAKRPLLRLTL